ncbi:hypothetical protein, partial [uncultured Alistipes sp.]|uniref:hypothetical protein n=1 Tax=uncultured Alistipes sp. TaxID=538949 RepID=UPI002626C6CE
NPTKYVLDFWKFGRNQRRKMCRNGYKIGRGVSPIKQVIGNPIQKSCPAPLSPCSHDASRT